MKTLPDVVDVDSTLVTGKPELRVVIDRARAADLGVRVADIAQALNTLVAGQKFPPSTLAPINTTCAYERLGNLAPVLKACSR